MKEENRLIHGIKQVEDIMWEYCSPDSYHSQITYFYGIVASSFLILSTTICLSYQSITNWGEMDNLWIKASALADTNNNGDLSLDEKLKMFFDMNIPINLPGETRSPTIEELRGYVKNYEGK
ncbi:hypothetical protein HYT57_01170 [Candidatus Woesearchaeota archaeon]|nr:hypothetical protein [Candidatus Woesearchaeota archaeon]